MAEKSRRSPLVVNRARLVAAFDRLMKSHIEYMGEKRPCLANLDKYCSPRDGGDVVLDAETREPPECDDSHDGIDVFLAWLHNDSFVCAAAVLRWIRTRGDPHPGCDLWDVALRELRDIFARNDPGHQTAHARGAVAVASSWLAELIVRFGIESEIPDRQSGQEGWVLHRVADEYQAAEHGVALESGGIMADCGAIQENEPGAFEGDEDFLGERVAELKKDGRGVRIRPSGRRRVANYPPGAPSILCRIV